MRHSVKSSFDVKGNDAYLLIISLMAQTGPVSFIVELMQGGLVRKHEDKVQCVLLARVF